MGASWQGRGRDDPTLSLVRELASDDVVNGVP